MCIRESVSRVRTLSHRQIQKKAWIRVQAFCMVHRREGREASTGFDKTPAFWTANGGPQGERSESSPLTAKFKEKAWIRVQAFCMVHRREGREASTGFDKTPAFWTANGGPQGERSESSPLTAKFKEKAWIRVQAFCMVHRREGRASFPSATVIPITVGYPRTLPLIFSPIHDMCPAVRRSFQQSAHGLSGRTKTQKLFLTGSAPLPIVAPRCSDDFATKNMVRCPSG